MSFIPLVSALIMIYLLNDHEPWMLATAGLSIGLIGLWSGMSALTPGDPRVTRPAQRLLDTREAWFPFFMLTFQGMLFILTALFWWFTISRFLFPMPPSYSLFVVTIICIQPLLRAFRARRVLDPHLPISRIEETLRAAVFTSITLLVTLVCYEALLTQKPGTMPRDQTVVAIIVWVPALVLLIFRLVLVLSRFVSGSPPPQPAPPQREPSLP
ncbi:MAG TPA: hypothetical protein PKE55_12535 [Kiritimatiellia bacterium]|nr:hypothetical protein [Kiritimatiellia bacterium]